MKIKLLCAVAAIAVGFAAEAAYADAPAPTPDFTITGDAAVVSNYKFRGIAQTDNKPTGQGAITVTHSSGFYVSTWFSGNSFNGGSEIDVYGGYSKTLKDGITLDGGLYGYLYPNAPAGESYELYADASKSFGPIGTKIGLNWAPKQAYFTTVGAATHYDMYEYAELTFSPAQLSALTVHGHLGHTGGGFDYGKDYIDYTAGVSYKIKSLTFDISAVGTTLSHNDVVPIGGESAYRLAKSVAVFSVTANF